MKKAKKVLLLALCAVLLVGATIAGTVAYLTSQTEVVKNTFTVGKVQILLDEKDVDTSNTSTDKASAAGRDLANKYHLMPGGTYEKDPTVHVHVDSENAYIRMKVTVTNYDKLATAFPKTGDTAAYWAGDIFLLEKLVDWNKDWTYEDCVVSGTTAVYEFRYKEIVVVDNLTTAAVKANDGESYKALPALFTTITIPGTISNEQIAALNTVEIHVVAHAIQSNNIEGGAEAAWTAFGN